ncbi:MAG TPA: RNA polymerase sigma factor [Pirellulaceae bacterium]|nr:RNA polymerase sigma factor [Pirellulaceae bacterium]
MSTGDEPDEWLMSQVANGRRESLAPLVRRYASPLLTYLRRMVGCEHRSEELFQEVFLQVWLKRQQYQYPRPFRPWLFTIATNHGRASFRKAKLPSVSLDAALATTPVALGPTPDESAMRGESAQQVAIAVSELPTQQRSVVVLRVWNELSYAEIGAIVGCGEETARSHMSHGLKALRKHLEPQFAK